MSTQPTDAELFALIKEHFGLDQRRDDTVINRSTGRFHDAQRYRDFAAAVLALAKWGQPAQAAEPVAWLRNITDPQPHAVTNLKYRSAVDAKAGVEYIPVYSAPQPVAREPLTDWDMRGQLAASLNCWHRLTPNEAAELVAFVQRVSAHGIKGGQHVGNVD